jgi:ADP-ribose pyrophosphatase
MSDIKEKELAQLGETQVDSQNIFDGFVLHVKKDTIKLPNGNEATREIIRHIGAVCVVPVTDDNKVIMERQFRYPIDRVITEIPAGKLDDKNEDRLMAAKRELREETGYEADEWLDLGIYYPAPAYSDEKITMYLAKGLHKGERDLDEDEFLNVEEIPIKSLVDDILSGKITDGKTQVAILKAAAHLNIS